MKTYQIRTDACSGTVLAPDINTAIREYFDLALSVQDLRGYFSQFDGAWCRIECGGKMLVKIGQCS
jgi:hypothetical protein